MNALELADELDKYKGIATRDAATMLRQQQSEIEELKTCLIVEQEHNERMVEDTIPYKDLHQVVKNVLAHPVKELTDDEIDMLVHEYNLLDDYPHEFVRACIRKAQEK